jgi:putative hydrolase
MAMKKWQKHSRYLDTGDWHCHTRYTDGRDTVTEMCRQAQKNGLELIAFTEHVRSRLSYDFGGLVDDVKKARKRFPKLRILVGCEAKVLNKHGSLDVSEDVLKRCDIVLGTFHSFPSLNEGDKSRLPSTSSKDEFESALKSMLSNPNVDMWTHPITFFQKCPLCKDDVHEIIEMCIKNNVLIEDNRKPAYMSPNFIEACRRMGAKIVRGSDAHGAEELLILNADSRKTASQQEGGRPPSNEIRQSS